MTFHEEVTSDFQKMLDYRKAVGYATDTYKSMVMPFIDHCVKITLGGKGLRTVLAGWRDIRDNY